eukprot:2497311-Alexandrium_andersonii.AAC.1
MRLLVPAISAKALIVAWEPRRRGVWPKVALVGDLVRRDAVPARHQAYIMAGHGRRGWPEQPAPQ